MGMNHELTLGQQGQLQHPLQCGADWTLHAYLHKVWQQNKSQSHPHNYKVSTKDNATTKYWQRRFPASSAVAESVV